MFAQWCPMINTKFTSQKSLIQIKDIYLYNEVVNGMKNEKKKETETKSKYKYGS